MNFIKSQNALVGAIMFPGGMSQASYSPETFSSSYNLKLLFVPFRPSCCNNFAYFVSAPTYIPVLLALNNNPKTNLFCIHFHGNACDIGQVAICAQREAQAYKAHYMLVEYPGYGISNGYSNEVVIDEVARTVHAFVEHELQVHYSKIVLIGRSIGTGPTCALASYLQTIGKPPAAVILQSPFTSIRDTASDLLGSITLCMLDRWENWQYLVGDNAYVVKCPVLFIHADSDKIINCNHSLLMHEHRLKHGLSSEIFIQKSNDRMVKGHNFFDYEFDVVVPSKEFLRKNVVNSEAIGKLLNLPMEVIQVHSIIPDEVSKHFSSGNQSEDRYILSPEQNSQSSKLTAPVYLSWACCPCAFCCEGITALSIRSIQESLNCFGCCKPAFSYQKLKPFDENNASCWNLFFQRSAAQKLAEDGVKNSTDKQNEVHNPLNSQDEIADPAPVTRRRSKSANINADLVAERPNSITIIEPIAEGSQREESHLDYIPG